MKLRELMRPTSGEAGQAMTETALLMSGLLVVAGVSLLAFAPDALAAFTIYIQGFYLVLGLPIG